MQKMPRNAENTKTGKWKLAASEAESATSFQVFNDIHKQKDDEKSKSIL